MKIFVPLFFAVLFVLSFFQAHAQEYYWVAFTDKNDTPYSLSTPENFLSERSIQRRRAQQIKIDSLDLPVNQSYINQVVRSGVSMVHSSKWLNGITVKVEINNFIAIVEALPFVKEVELTKPGVINKSAIIKFNESQTKSGTQFFDASLYGESLFQLTNTNGQYLHNAEYEGQGMEIAVLDAGFYNVDTYAAFDSLWVNGQVRGYKDFVNPGDDFFATDYHGMSVLSCMGGNIPNELIGTAPKASYWLLRSEEKGSEYLIEEDNWVAAAEFADSVGADVINSSLGYFLFNDTSMNHTYVEMDGHTTRVTRGANIAASRGMLVFSSAGNERNDPWKYIIAPSDGDNVIAVGAVDVDSIPANFSSSGPASDGDVKPNVSTVGRNTVVQLSNGEVGYSNGTSFSSPVMAGLGACLWQANRRATAEQIKSAIEQSANLFSSPDSIMGYGIPDFMLADQLLKSSLIAEKEIQNSWIAYPNPAKDVVLLKNTGLSAVEKVEVDFYSVDGRFLGGKQFDGSQPVILRDLQFLPSGLIILKIRSDNSTESLRLIKSR